MRLMPGRPISGRALDLAHFPAQFMGSRLAVCPGRGGFRICSSFIGVYADEVLSFEIAESIYFQGCRRSRRGLADLRLYHERDLERFPRRGARAARQRVIVVRRAGLGATKRSTCRVQGQLPGRGIRPVPGGRRRPGGDYFRRGLVLRLWRARRRQACSGIRQNHPEHPGNVESGESRQVRLRRRKLRLQGEAALLPAAV